MIGSLPNGCIKSSQVGSSWVKLSQVEPSQVKSSQWLNFQVCQVLKKVDLTGLGTWLKWHQAGSSRFAFYWWPLCVWTWSHRVISTAGGSISTHIHSHYPLPLLIYISAPTQNNTSLRFYSCLIVISVRNLLCSFTFQYQQTSRILQLCQTPTTYQKHYYPTL